MGILNVFGRRVVQKLVSGDLKCFGFLTFCLPLINGHCHHTPTGYSQHVFTALGPSLLDLIEWHSEGLPRFPTDTENCAHKARGAGSAPCPLATTRRLECCLSAASRSINLASVNHHTFAVSYIGSPAKNPFRVVALPKEHFGILCQLLVAFRPVRSGDRAWRAHSSFPLAAPGVGFRWRFSMAPCCH